MRILIVVAILAMSWTHVDGRSIDREKPTDEIQLDLAEETMQLTSETCEIDAVEEGGRRLGRMLGPGPPGKVINSSTVTLTCRPETGGGTITVPPGGTGKIDAICPSLTGCPGTGNCCVLKVCDGCTATVTGAGPVTVSITCAGFKSWCCQKFRGGLVDQWW